MLSSSTTALQFERSTACAVATLCRLCLLEDAPKRNRARLAPSQRRHPLPIHKQNATRRVARGILFSGQCARDGKDLGGHKAGSGVQLPLHQFRVCRLYNGGWRYYAARHSRASVRACSALLRRTVGKPRRNRGDPHRGRFHVLVTATCQLSSESHMAHEWAR